MHIIPIGVNVIIHEVKNGFLKKRITVILALDFKNIKYVNLVTLTDVEPINPNAIMTILPGGTRNVFIRSPGLSPDFDECYKKLLTFDNFQNVDNIAAIVMANNEENSKPKYRLFINATEMGLGAEIIDKS